eukprot:7118584-Pyramimonas_sp.AAC.1
MGGVTRAGTRVPVLAAHGVHVRRIRGFQELHPEGGAREETRPKTIIFQVGPELGAYSDSSVTRITGLSANVSQQRTCGIGSVKASLSTTSVT